MEKRRGSEGRRHEDRRGGIFAGPDEGRALPNPVGGQMVVKIRDEDTAGAYSIYDNTIPAGSPGPRPHSNEKVTSTPIVHQCKRMPTSSPAYAHHENGLPMRVRGLYRTQVNYWIRLHTAEVAGSYPSIAHSLNS